jgi:hypothetical protein
MEKKPPSRKRKKSQHEKFVELARASGADESESAFVAKVRAISSSKVARAEPATRNDKPE